MMKSDRQLGEPWGSVETAVFDAWQSYMLEDNRDDSLVACVHTCVDNER